MDSARSYTFVAEYGSVMPWMAKNALPQLCCAPLIGRDALLDSLVDRLMAGRNLALTSDDTPGIGLTALATAIAHDPLVRAHFSNGVLWASLGKQPTLSAILTQWASDLGIEANGVCDLTKAVDEIALSRALTGVIGARRMLLVIDDAWSLADIRLLQCGGMNCTYLLTTDQRYLAREFAGAENSCLVRELTLGAAYDLLQTLAPAACAADPDLSAQAAHAAGGIPLSIKLLAGYLSIAAERDALRARLGIAMRRLDIHDHTNTKLQQAIALSLTDLPAPALRAFYNLGAFVPAPATFTRAAAIAVTQTDDATIDQLILRNLIEPARETPGALALHPAIAGVARVRRDPKTVARHRAFYLAAASNCADDWPAMHVLYPQLAHAWAVAPDEPGLLEFAWVARAYQERAGMRQTIEAWAARCKAITAMHVQDANGQDQVLSISRAVATGELTDFASVLFSIGSAYEHLGRRKEALEFYNRACAAQEEAGEYSALAITLNNIGSLYYELNQFGAALKYLRQSAAIHEQHGDPACAQLGQTYNNLGVICTSLGLAPDAVNYFALSLSNHMGRQDHASESVTRANLAKFHHLRGPLSAAVEQMHRVVELDQLTASSNVDKHRAKLAQLRCEQAVEIARGGSHVSAETSPGSMFSRTAGNGLILKTPDNIKQVVRAAIKGRVARLPSIGISND